MPMRLRREGTDVRRKCQGTVLGSEDDRDLSVDDEFRLGN